MITRRKVLLALGVLAALPAFAQQEKRVRRIGYFSGASLASNVERLGAFRLGMAELRWVEGRDYVIDERYADGLPQAAAGLADELVASRPDLLLAAADEVTHLLAQRTRSIPIVFAVSQDPVQNGFAASLQRPGGNATGLTTMAPDLSGKRLQLLKEAFPRVAHVALLFDSTDAGSRSVLTAIEEAARRLKMRISPIELRRAADIEPAFRRGAALGAQAYVLASGFSMTTQRKAIADRVLRARAPAIFSSYLAVDSGGLMSYGPSQQDNFRRAAAYVDKILKGAKPGELPVEQPVKFELVLNLKTARAMGLKFPQTFLARADRVIE